MKLPVSAGAFSCFSLEPFCMAHSLIMEGENAPRGNVNGTPSWGVHSLKGESRQRWEKLSRELCDCNPTATAVVVGQMLCRGCRRSPCLRLGCSLFALCFCNGFFSTSLRARTGRFACR